LNPSEKLKSIDKEHAVHDDIEKELDPQWTSDQRHNHDFDGNIKKTLPIDGLTTNSITLQSQFKGHDTRSTGLNMSATRHTVDRSQEPGNLYEEKVATCSLGPPEVASETVEGNVKKNCGKVGTAFAAEAASKTSGEQTRTTGATINKSCGEGKQSSKRKKSKILDTSWCKLTGPLQVKIMAQKAKADKAVMDGCFPK